MHLKLNIPLDYIITQDNEYLINCHTAKILIVLYTNSKPIRFFEKNN